MNSAPVAGAGLSGGLRVGWILKRFFSSGLRLAAWGYSGCPSVSLHRQGLSVEDAGSGLICSSAIQLSLLRTVV